MRAKIIKVKSPDKYLLKLIDKEFEILKKYEGNRYLLGTRYSGIINWDSVWDVDEIQLKARKR